MNFRIGVLKYFTLLFACLLFNSCNDLVYSPEKENFVNVPVPQTKMNVDLSNSTDTVYVFGKTDFHLTTDTKGKQFHRIVAYVDSVRDGDSGDKSLYTLNTESYSNGKHKLRIEIWAFSGSGSLADHYGSEFLVSSSQWNLYIDNRLYVGQILIDSCFFDNGSLTVHWQKYPYYNFISYDLYSSPVNSSGQAIAYNLVASITDRNINSIRDSSYVGNGIKYMIRVKAENFLSTSPEKYYYDDAVSIYSCTQLDENTVKIVCSRIKYYNNVSKFTLYRSYTWSHVTVSERTSLDDTVFYDTPGFGCYFAYWIGVYSKTNSSGYSSNYKMSLGNSFRPFDNLIYIPQINSYYLTYNSQTDRLDPANFNVLATCRGAVIPSPSGTYAYSNNYAPSNDPYPHSFTKVNPLTLQSESPTVYTDKYVGFYSRNENFAVSESGVCMYVGRRYNTPNIMGYIDFVLFDPGKPGVIGRDSTTYPNNGELIKISKLTDEGEYLVTPCGDDSYEPYWDYLSKIKNRTMFSYGRLKNGPIVFDQSGKNYICTGNSSISFFNCSEESPIKSYPLSSGDMLYSPCIDPSTGYLGGYSKKFHKYRIYDLSNGNLLHEIQLASDKNAIAGNFYLYNSTLFANGSYMNLASFKKRNFK